MTVQMGLERRSLSSCGVGVGGRAREFGFLPTAKGKPLEALGHGME